MVGEFERISDIKRLEFIADVLQKTLPRNAIVLDVGCGNGIISRSLGLKGFKVLGIDISAKAIERANSLNKLDNVSFKVMSAEQLAVNHEQYHAVICSEVLEHLYEPQKLLQVLYHSLRDDGVLIVTVPNGKGPRELFVTKPIQALQHKNNWVWKFVKYAKRLLGYKGTTVQSSADDLKHIQFFTKTTLQKLASDTSFQIVRFGKTNFIDDVFPLSFFAKRFKMLQKIDCAIANVLPHSLNGGFVTVWKKYNQA